MTKILLNFLSILAVISLSKAQNSSPLLLDASPASLYQNLVIQSAASKLMAVPLPEDLQIKLGQVLSVSEAGFSLCDVFVDVSSPTIFNKKSKKCALKQFKTVITQLALIEQEAILRNATSSTTTTTTTTPVPITLAPTTLPTTATTTTPAPTNSPPTISTTRTTTPASTTSPPTTSTTTTTTPPLPTILPTTIDLASDELL